MKTETSTTDPVWASNVELLTNEVNISFNI